jgi:hypothetical protein
MKRILSFIFLLAFIYGATAQAPNKMSYQAVVRDNNNKLVPNSNIGMQISILHGNATGTTVYIERHFPSTNDNGLVTIEIGTGVLISGDFMAVDWRNGPYFIKTEIDLNGGANYTISGTTQLLSVPYAIYANSAENVVNETDPIFNASLAKNITEQDTAHWGNDVDPTNEIQQLSRTGNSLSLSKEGGTVVLPDSVVGYTAPVTAGFGTTTSKDLAAVTFELSEKKTVLILADVNIWGSGTKGCEETIRLSIDGNPEDRTAVHIDIQEAVGGNNGDSAFTSWMTTLGAGTHTVKLRAWDRSCPFHKHAHLHVLVLGN